MTINDKHQGSSEKHLEGQKAGDQQVAGKPITDKHDNAAQQRLEQQTAAKAFRFTKDGGNAFTIDFGDGKAVQDKRPLQQDSAVTRDLTPAVLTPDGTVYDIGKDGKLHPAKDQPYKHDQEQAHKAHKDQAHSRDLTPATVPVSDLPTSVQPKPEQHGHADQTKQKHEQHDQSGKHQITGERGLETDLRPKRANESFDEKEHLWHDKKTGKVVPPPEQPSYGAASALYTADVLYYQAYKITHPGE
ncbi:MAG TPA: hypothetical protein V6C86_03495 [Oculatellaceae cyanobacterium]